MWWMSDKVEKTGPRARCGVPNYQQLDSLFKFATKWSSITGSLRVSTPKRSMMFGLRITTLIARSWGQHGAHLGPKGPRWAPCCPQKLCYLGILWMHAWRGPFYCLHGCNVFPHQKLNGLPSPIYAGLLLIESGGTNISEIWIKCPLRNGGYFVSVSMF